MQLFMPKRHFNMGYYTLLSLIVLGMLIMFGAFVLGPLFTFLQ